MGAARLSFWGLSEWVREGACCVRACVCVCVSLWGAVRVPGVFGRGSIVEWHQARVLEIVKRYEESYEEVWKAARDAMSAVPEA